jgi:hypothetical protein
LAPMKPRHRRWELAVTGAVLVAALLACKKKAQPDPEQAAPSAPAPVTADPAAAAPVVDAEAARVKQPVVVRTVHKTDAGAKKTDAGAAVDAGGKPAANAAADASAGPSASQIAACAQKCQGALQKCLLIPPAGGGLPSAAHTKECADAFSACRTACTGG